MSFDASKYKECLIKMCVNVHGLGEYAHTEQRDKPPHSDSTYVRHCEKNHTARESVKLAQKH